MITVNFEGDCKNVSAQLYQWDYGQQLRIEELKLPETFEMHFQNGTGYPITVEGKYENNIGIVDIPDECLQQVVSSFKGWLYIENETSGKTLVTVVFYLQRREQPSDTPPIGSITEIKGYADYVAANAQKVAAAEQAASDASSAAQAAATAAGNISASVESIEDGAEITVTDSDGTTRKATVYNGAQGRQGPAGPQGPAGADAPVVRTQLNTESAASINVANITDGSYDVANAFTLLYTYDQGESPARIELEKGSILYKNQNKFIALSASGAVFSVYTEDFLIYSLEDLVKFLTGSVTELIKNLQDVVDIIPTKISELINDSGFASGTYSKPNGGIPASDMSSAVRASLAKAESALQKHQSLTDYYTKAEVNSLISSAIADVSALIGGAS